MIETVLFPELEQRLLKASPVKAIIKQGIKIKFADFQQTTIEHTFQVFNITDFKPMLEDILTRQKGREIRLLGLNVMLKPSDLDRQLRLL